MDLRKLSSFKLPKVSADGTYNIDEVLAYAKTTSTEYASKRLNIPLHRIIFFQTKSKENKNERTVC